MYNRRMLTGVSTEVLAMDDSNNILYGINFASADYLGLAQNNYAKEAAIEAANAARSTSSEDSETEESTESTEESTEE